MSYLRKQVNLCFRGQLGTELHAITNDLHEFVARVGDRIGKTRAFHAPRWRLAQSSNSESGRYSLLAASKKKSSSDHSKLFSRSAISSARNSPKFSPSLAI